MSEEISYPLSLDWSTEEVVDVIHFFEAVEAAYENEISSEDVLERYRRFKKVVPSKSEEKQVFRQFEEQSGYVPYRVVKQAGSADKVRMTK
ncbi:UPF0223 family protein [Alkalicoccus urumqiensis]|uniref:UPF0223 protein C6I21_12710 n=1 Tax=Alkalicoccus urumqiensis TaxID=1548213 RepID=A0A2P6MEN3_ALKUR|nr:UPF0223 family protein [Alkalicoccus urumqiensis]PRO64765.1 hypothetical protein C6I21_12710 [Alkalicoccus urumqiensis]